jgi:outer membrane protein assembly factor BamB
MRRITQIAIDSAIDTTTLLYALCDDGTVWGLEHSLGEEIWKLKTPIPQFRIDATDADAAAEQESANG